MKKFLDWLFRRNTTINKTINIDMSATNTILEHILVELKDINKTIAQHEIRISNLEKLERIN